QLGARVEGVHGQRRDVPEAGDGWRGGHPSRGLRGAYAAEQRRERQAGREPGRGAQEPPSRDRGSHDAGASENSDPALAAHTVFGFVGSIVSTSKLTANRPFT